LNPNSKSESICPNCGKIKYLGHWVIPIRETKGVWICEKEDKPKLEPQNVKNFKQEKE